MTCIIGVKKGGVCYIASDTQCTLGNEQKHLKNPKVLHFLGQKNFIVGVAGLLSAINNIKYFNGEITEFGEDGTIKMTQLKMDELTRDDVYKDIGDILYELMNPPKIGATPDKEEEDVKSCAVFALNGDLFMTDSGGTVVETEEAVMGVGSGSAYAVAVANALMKHSPRMKIENVLKIALETACELDIYSGGKFYMVTTDSDEVIEL